MSAHPQMWLKSDTPHRLANTFQLSAYAPTISVPTISTSRLVDILDILSGK